MNEIFIYLFSIINKQKRVQEGSEELRLESPCKHLFFVRMSEGNVPDKK